MIPRLSLGEQCRSGTQPWVQLHSPPAPLTTCPCGYRARSRAHVMNRRTFLSGLTLGASAAQVHSLDAPEKKAQQ